VERLETVVRNTLAAVLVAGGLVLGFAHVRGNAQTHGQHGWRADAIAVTVALVALYALLEVRKRYHDRMSLWPALGLLVAGLGLSMGSQLAEAERSAWGWLYAGWPVLVDLWVVKLVAARIGASSAGGIRSAGRAAPPDGEATEPEADPPADDEDQADELEPVRSLREEIEAALDEGGNPVAARKILDSRGIKTDSSYVNKIHNRRQAAAG